VSDQDEYVTQCVGFFNSIGLVTRIEAGATGFTSGVDIRDGVLYVDPEVASASNLLHEGGHLAPVPAQYRRFFQENVESGQRIMLSKMDEEGVEPDSPLFRATLQCSDVEATAWAWAAGKYLGVPDEEIIKDHEYGGDGDSIRLQLQMRAYVGISGLSYAGFCASGPMQSRASGLPVFPAMKMWVQPEALSPKTKG
jgi:hypothetical protein